MGLVKRALCENAGRKRPQTSAHTAGGSTLLWQMHAPRESGGGHLPQLGMRVSTIGKAAILELRFELWSQ